MQLIVISNPEDIANEAAIINNLFSAGLSRLHLRKPLSSAQKICALLNGINPAFYNRIALHQHHQLAQAYGITQLHYTEQMRTHVLHYALEAQKENGYKLTTSVHDIQIIPSLTAFNYVFFGPVFNSLSKPGYESRIGPDFRLHKKWVQPEVIALGGIEAQHLPIVKSMGFDGAAVSGAIWNQPEKATETFEQLQSTIAAL